MLLNYTINKIFKANMHSSEKFCEHVSSLCAEYLGGVWDGVKPREIRIKPLSGGMSNEVYLVSVPAAIKHTVAGEPRHVLMRLYGSHLRDDPTRLTRDAVVFALLAERKLGPKLHGIFPGGRFEEYIPCRTLRPHELSSPHISLNIASKVAKLHTINMPLTKKPSWLFDNMKEWFEDITAAYEEQVPQRDTSSAEWGLLEKILGMNLLQEVDKLEEIIIRNAEHPCAQLLPQVVFCHNDLQGGNILLAQQQLTKNGSTGGRNSLEISEKTALPTSADALTFIDYEYSSYNYRSFDIANHFMEWTFDYSRKEAPYFRYEPQKFPSREQQLAFVQRYLQEAAPHIFNGEAASDVAQRQYVDWMLSSIRLHTMSSHMLYATWALAQYLSSNIRFGYLDYASTRLSGYFEERRQNGLFRE